MTAATVRAQQIPAEVLYWEHVNSRRAGHQTTIGEIKDLMHVWRYVGDLLGVQADDYPETFRDSTIQLTFASMVKRAYSAGRDGEEPVESYVPAFRPRPASPVGKLQFPVVFTLEAFRRLIPPLDDAADHVQRWRRNRWYANDTGGSGAKFIPVEEFRR